MEHSGSDAAVKDALIKLRKEEYARGTRQIAIRKRNLLNLDQNLRCKH